MRFGAIFLALVFWLASATVVLAAPYPPMWDYGTGSSDALHFPRAEWPTAPAAPQDCGENCGDWQPYTRFGHTINDPRIQDPSNGGTSPQNYVNISSSCVDTALPSIYYSIDSDNEVLFFRWRVAQIAHTYATGPNAGAFGSSAPWNSALWTVFFDTTGDGYRNYAAHLDGSSGSPATPIDRLVGIWANQPANQSIDYQSHPTIHELGHSPTAFVDPVTNRLLNFGSGSTPTAVWPNGSSETLWDYGTTRAKMVSISPGPDNCNEYFVDYQIPFGFLDAAAVGGPTVDEDTALSLLFCTANSLNNPLQKDCALEDPWVSNTYNPGAFGDFMTLGGEVYQQPIVMEVAVAGCGPATLTATVNDALHVVNGQIAPSIDSVEFFYYVDTNQNGIADDGNQWISLGTGTAQGLNRWTTEWDSSLLTKGSYLLGIQALDQAGLNESGVAHRTFSYLTQSQVDQLTPTSGEAWFGNPPVQGVSGQVTLENTCGQPLPYLSKSVEPQEVSAGEMVTFTVTVHNTFADDDITVDSLTDMLPTGFVYEATEAGGTLDTPASSPAQGNTDEIVWTFSPAADVPANDTRTLVFTASAPTATGTYANVAHATSSAGDLKSAPAEIGVGAPRLTLSKTPSTFSASPGELVTYTLRYANDSPIDVVGAVITDTLPTGLALVQALDGGVFEAGTITWTVGELLSGDEPRTVRFTGVVEDPYPDTAEIPLVNTAVIDSPQTAPTQARAGIYVDAPRPNLTVQKGADRILVGPGEQVVFTVQYHNIGNAIAAGVTITDTIPAGFTLVSASDSGSVEAGVVTWNLGDVAAGALGSVTLTLTVDDPFGGDNPTINTAWIQSAQTDPVSGAASVGIQSSGEVCTDYYFRNDTENVGAAGSQHIANTTTPTSGTAATLSQMDVGATEEEIARFYSHPATTSVIDFVDPVDMTIYVDKNGSPQAQISVELYSYDPATAGNGTLLGSVDTPNLTGNQSNQAYQLSITPSGNVSAGHRLLWIIKGVTLHASQTNNLGIHFDGTSSLSRAQICPSLPANLVMDKRASAASVVGGDALTYTLRFANVGGSSASNAVITETLPTGVSFVGATLNSNPISPTTAAGQELIFVVNSDDTGTLGQISGGEAGELVIEVQVDAPLTPDVLWLTNAASLDSDETEPAMAATTTGVLHPALSIVKQASVTALRPGDVVTYTLTVLNNGAGAANNVTITDALPVETFFTYVAESVRLNGTPVGTPDPVSADRLDLNIGDLAPGATAQISYQMAVAASGAPGGVTAYDNTAWAGSTQTEPVESDAVIVGISTNPNLRIVKTAQSVAPLTPGDLITYTLMVSNVGSGVARAVFVHDPIPANTSYVNGSLVLDGIDQTDVPDGDGGHFDATDNRVIFAIDELAGQGSHTFQFTVQVNEALPAGTTTLDNTAVVGASNHASRTASADADATAAPVLTIQKQGPQSVAYPGARVAQAASGTTTLEMDDATQLAAGQHIWIGGQDTAQIVAIEGNTVELDAPVSASIGDSVVADILYNIIFANAGNAPATGVLITDTLPAGAGFVDATQGGIHASGLVSWSVGTLAPGDGGSMQVRIFPDAPGALVNTVEIGSEQTLSVADSVTTAAGGLRPSKRAESATVEQTQSGVVGTYVIEIENTLPSAATGVIITDTLPDGFTYLSTVQFDGGSRSDATPDPTPGDEQPVWGTFSIPGQSTLALTFTVAVSSSVGPATYDNFIDLEANAPAVEFDALAASSDDVTVIAADLVVAKTVTPTATYAGQPVTYTIALENVGNAPAYSVAITDVLPTGFVYTATPSLQMEDATRTTTIDPSAGDTQPSWAAWSIQPGGLVTITFLADTGSVTGTFSNTVVVETISAFTSDLENVAPVVLTALPVPPTPPTAVNDSEEGVPGEPVGVDVLANDTVGDAPLDPTTVAIQDNGTPVTSLIVADEGVWTVDPVTGIITFTPERGFEGNPTAIQYTVQDDNGATSNAATVTVTYITPSLTANVGGLVWLDQNKDGLIFDAVTNPESGLAGVTVHLYQSGVSETISSTVSDSEGQYDFEALAPGDYYLEFVLFDDNHSFTIPNAGDDISINSQAYQPKLELEVVDRTGGAVATGDAIDYTIVVYNQDGRAAHGVELVMTVPTFTSLPGDENSQWTCNENGGAAGDVCRYALSSVATGDNNKVETPLRLRVDSAIGTDTEDEAPVVTLDIHAIQRTNGRTPILTLTAGDEESSINAGVIDGVRPFEIDTPMITPIVLPPTSIPAEEQPEQGSGILFVPTVQR